MSTRDRVLAALKDAGSHGLSGEALATDLGVSRVAVGKHVSVLRDLGYEVAAHPGSGYVLLSSPDIAIPTEVRPLVAADFWRRFEGGVQVPSTNDVARALARDGAEEGTVVVAASQSCGRGRLGRSWESPVGGVYLSAVLRPAIAPAQAGPLSLVIGLGVARGLAGLGATVGLKWPNDVWLAGAKVAGILLEMNAEHDRVDWVVAGIGVNVQRDDVVTGGSAAVRDARDDVRVAEVAAAVLDGVASAYLDWARGGFSCLVEEYAALDVLRGHEVTVSDARGTAVARGVSEGVDVEGRLVVRGDDDTLTPVFAGEVTLRA